MKKINIAIDGVAGSGKSDIAKRVAQKLNYKYVDTGSMYRCVAYLMIEKDIKYDEEEKIKLLLDNDFNYQYNNQKVILNNKDVSIEIRSNEVNDLLPYIVPIPLIRKFLVKFQQELAKEKGVVMDGRDIGSVVLKDAELKIYQTADLEVRATRRYKQNLQKGIKSSYNEVLENLKSRDYVDKYVSHALVKVDDAIEIDTTNMSIEEVVNRILELVEMRVKE